MSQEFSNIAKKHYVYSQAIIATQFTIPDVTFISLAFPWAGIYILRMKTLRRLVFFTGISFLLLSGTSHADSLGWKWFNPYPQGNEITSVWSVSASETFIAGNNGMLRYYDGSNWHFISNPINWQRRYIYHVWGLSKSELYLCTLWSRSIYRYDGSTWSDMYVGRSLRGNIWGSSSSDIYVVAATPGPSINFYGYIYHYNGITWSNVYASVSDETTIYDIWGSAPDDVYFVGWADFYSGDSSIIHYDGSSWTEYIGLTPPLRSIWGVSSTEIYTNSDNELFKFDGSTWLLHSDFTSTSLSHIWASGSDNIMMTGQKWIGPDFVPLIFHFNGTTWHENTVSVGLTLGEIHGSAPTDIYAVGKIGEIMHYDGTTWSSKSQRIEYLADYNVGAIWASSLTDVFYAGVKGSPLSRIMVHYDGTTCSITPINTRVFSIWGNSSSDLFAVGRDYEPIIHYDGITWSSLGFDSDDVFNDVWGTSSTNVWTVGWKRSGANSYIWHYDGFTWSNAVDSLPVSFKSVWGFSESDVYVGGTVIFQYDGANWTMMGTQPPYSGDSATSIWGTNDSNLYITRNEEIYQYDGSTWSCCYTDTNSWIKIFGSSEDDIFAFAGDFEFPPGQIIHFDGFSWSLVDNIVFPELLDAFYISKYTQLALGTEGTILYRNVPRVSISGAVAVALALLVALISGYLLSVNMSRLQY